MFFNKIAVFILLPLFLLFHFDAQAQFGFGKKISPLGTQSKVIDYGNPKEYTIAGISVVGSKYLDHNALTSMSGLRTGDRIKIPSEIISQAIKKIWKQGLVGDVEIAAEKIEGDKIWLQIILTERPRLSRFYFEGVSKGQTSSLNEKIKLIRGRVVNDVTMKNTENTVKQFFIEKGYNNINVKVIPKKDSILSNHVSLLIKVNKGVKIRTNKIEFEGVTALKERKLRRKMKKTKDFRFLGIFKPMKFLEKEFENDKKALIAYYQQNGYRDAQIAFDTVIKKNEQFVDIKIKINEGKQYFYRNITWNGNFVYDSALLGKILGIKKGDIYDTEELQKRLNFNPTGSDITSLYMDDGYLFFSINPVEVAVENDSVDVEMRIFEGEQATINKVVLTGNTRTSDHVVLREIRTLPGQKFSRSDLIRTQRELATLGYFDPEQIGIQPKPNGADGTVDIHYKVVEKPSDQVELSGGWGGVFGFVGTLGLVFNNFSARKIANLRAWSPLPQGDGQKLAVRFQANGRRFQTYSFTFTEPWLGGKRPNNFSFNVQHSVQRLINYYTNVTTGSLQVTGVTLTLGRRLAFPDDFFTLSNSVSYLRYGLNNYGGLFRTVKNGDFNNLLFNTTIARNSIDNPIYPRSGSNMVLSVNLTPPYSVLNNKDYSLMSEDKRFQWIEYHKWMFDNWWYLNLWKDLVVSARAHIGYIGSYRASTGISPFERFIVGGDGMMLNNFLLGTDIVGLRGYTNQSIRPEKVEGGVVFNKYVMELRYPVTLSQAASIYALVFAEGGNNWGSARDVNPFDLKKSVGAGVRIFMPAIGVLGIDYGWGFDPIPGNPSANNGQFHFTIGQMIR